MENSDRFRISLERINTGLSHRFDGPSPTITSRMDPQNVRCGGKIARGNLPGVAFAK
jgi:hypothetical protein